MLYPSLFFDKNRMLYYDKLSIVRTQNDMLQWVKFFLTGIEQTASMAVEKLVGIIKLKERIEMEINTSFGRRSHSAITLLQSLFRNPFTTVEQASKVCNLSHKSVGILVAMMQQKNYLKEITGQSRNRLFAFQVYLDIFNGE